MGGYVAAIKAGQEGLKVRSSCSTFHSSGKIEPFRLRVQSLNISANCLSGMKGCMYRKAWSAGRNVFKCWLYPIEIST